MKQLELELEQLIESARLDKRSELFLNCDGLTTLPESLGSLTRLTWLNINTRCPIALPESIGNLSKLTYLNIYLDTYNRSSKRSTSHQSIELPTSVGNLANLQQLHLNSSSLDRLPDSIGNLSNLEILNLENNQLTSLPASIGNLSKLVELNLYGNQLNSLPESISNLSRLGLLDISNNQLNKLPVNIGNLSNLTELNLSTNQLRNVSDSLSDISKLTKLELQDNQLTHLPDNIGNLFDLVKLNLHNNQLMSLPQTICNLSELTELTIDRNPLTDLSMITSLPQLKTIKFFDIELPRRYWNKFSEWEPEWLLDETNAEIRRTLIEQVGYEKICQELNAIELDVWREYTLLKIDDLEPIYNLWKPESIGLDPMIFLKMTCPSTAHIHILRVPPEMTSAEEAITWVNHGIHPDRFAVQT